MISISKIKNIIARYLLTFITPWTAAYWADKPFGGKVQSSKEGYLNLWENEKSNTYPDIDTLEYDIGEKIDKDWMDNLALHTQIVIKSSPLCYQHGRILYAVLKSYCAQSDAKNLTIFETGTARGFSSIIMSKALEDAKKPGKIITFDVLPHYDPIYWNCIDDNEGKKSRAQLLSSWEKELDNIIFIEGDSRLNLKTIKSNRIHFAFLDGAHSYEHVLFEFCTIADKQKPNDIIVFDDYNYEDFQGLVMAVDDGCEKWSYDKVVLNIGRRRCYVVATKR